MSRDKMVVAYILSRTGCIHPFRLSRLLALAEMRMMNIWGRRITDLKYVPGPGVFFVEGLKEMMEGDECFVFHKGDPTTGKRGCVEYVCSVPVIDDVVKQVIDNVLEEYGDLDDMSLNNAAISHPLYKKLVGDTT